MNETKLCPNAAVTLEEYMNDNRITEMLCSPFVPDNLKRGLRQLKKRKIDDNTYRIEYAHALNAVPGTGRLFARGTSLQNLEARCHQFRQYLASDRLHDIDQINSMPLILNHLCSINDVTNPNLQYYVEHRSEILDLYNLEKGAVLAILLFRPRKVENEFFKSIHQSLYDSLVPKLKLVYPDIWKKVAASRDQKTKINPEGSFLCKITHTIENQITLAMSKFFDEQGYTTVAYVFDGCMLMKQEGIEIPKTLLTSCEEFILEETGVPAKLAEKPLIVPEQFLKEYSLKLLDDVPKREEENNKEKDELNFLELKSLPLWKNFDVKRVIIPTHKNSAEWFMELKGNTIMRHSSGLLFVLGKDNIWKRHNDVFDTDLNLQVANVLIAKFREMLQEVDDNGQEANAKILKGHLSSFQKLIETNSFSCNVSKNIERMQSTNDRCVELFISKPHLFAFTDGVVDLSKGGEFRPIIADDYITFTCGYPYPQKKDDNIQEHILDFYSSIFATRELVTHRFQIVARCLYGKQVDEIFYVLKGRGRNGKGTEETLIRNAFGGYHYSLNKKNLTLDNGSVDAANSQLYSLYGKRYISTSESNEKDRFISEIIKGLTGNDPLTVRTLNGKPISFVVSGLLNIQTNDPIRYDKVDFALAKRSRCQEYPFSFEVEEDTEEDTEDGESMDVEDMDIDEDNSKDTKKINKDLKTLFASDEYRNQFILMLIEYCSQEIYPRNFKVSVPNEVIAFTQSNLMESSTAGVWLKTHYIITNDSKDRVGKKDLYDHYAEEVGERAMGKQIFFKELGVILKEVKSNGKISYVGVRLKNMF
jgi:phage/plasmid-associated DNA primase